MTTAVNGMAAIVMNPSSALKLVANLEVGEMDPREKVSLAWQTPKTGGERVEVIRVWDADFKEHNITAWFFVGCQRWYRRQR